MEELQLQLEALRLDLERERSKRLALEDECDLLAVANQDLQAEVLQLKSTMPTNTVFNQPERAVATVFIEGDGDYVKSAALTVSSACGGMNVLSVCFCRYSTNNNSTHEEIIVCGGGDKRVYGYSQTTQTQIFCVELSAPVLSLDACGSFLAASTMDGSHSYWNANDPSTIHSAKDHSKYVVCIRWSCGGKLLATASYDKTSRIYAVKYTSFNILSQLYVITLCLCCYM
jgi:WD40 repeat protein